MLWVPAWMGACLAVEGWRQLDNSLGFCLASESAALLGVKQIGLQRKGTHQKEKSDTQIPQNLSQEAGTHT